MSRYRIGGVISSDKTAVIPQLKRILSDSILHYFDSINVLNLPIKNGVKIRLSYGHKNYYL